MTIQYTSFDFTTLKTDLITLLSNTQIFRDYNFEGANITELLEMAASIGDYLDFFINATANECYIGTVDLYKNANNLTELIKFKPGGPKSDTLSINVSGNFDFNQDDDWFEIPVFTSLTATTPDPDGQPIKYLTTSTLTFVGVSGNNILDQDIDLIQGDRNTDDPLYFSGTGEKFQRCEIDDDAAIEEYLEVYVNDVKWTKVDSLYRDVINTSQVFTTRYNANQRVEVQFGDDVYGASPVIGTNNIKVYYIATLKLNGRIGANELTVLDIVPDIIDAYTGLAKGTVEPIITQTETSDGGAEPFTVEEIKNYGPGFYRAQDRAVNEEDHNSLLLAEYGSYILDVKCLNSDDYFTLTSESPATSGLYYNNVYIYILPKYSDILSASLKDSIQEYLDDYKMTSINYVFKDVTYIDINATCEFKKTTTTTKTTATLTQDISNVLRAYFARQTRKLGDVIMYSQIISAIQAIEGISSCTLSINSSLDPTPVYEDIILTTMQFPKLGTTSISPTV